MEIDNDFKFAFSSFCDKNKTLQYFVEFRDFLQEADDIIELKKLTTFTRNVHFLDKINLIGCNNNVLQNDVDNLIVSCPNDLNEVLLSVLRLLCTKHLKLIFELQEVSQNLNIILATFEIVAYFMKLYGNEIKGNDYFEVLISTLCNFFEKLSSILKDQYTAINESESAPLYYSSLKFLVKILKCVPACNERDYLSESLILRIIDTLLFPDSTTVKFFINNIFPNIIQISLSPLKEKIFTSLWNIICLHYKTCDETHGSEAKSCAYNMLCCLSENVYNCANLNMEIHIHNETVFWNIILSGVTSNLPSTRKKALNVFKLFLLWRNRSGRKDSADKLLLIGSQSEEDVKIWNDVVILFECLEEKQIHVIKPVLPKFARILSLTIKQDAVSPSNKNFDLASSWVMALINRMLKHETKYVIRWALSTVLSLDYITYPIHKHDSELFIKILVEAFNEQTLYSRNNEQDNYSLFLSSEKISLFLKNYICTLESQNSEVALLRCLISNIAMQSWCVVALLHLTFALTEMKSIPAWNQEDLLHIRKIIVDCQRSQEPAFRAALECFMLECCSLFLDWNSMNFGDLADLLVIFKSSAILHNTRPWTKFASRLSDVFSSGSSSTLTRDKAFEFCTECIKNVLTVEDTGAGIKELGIEKVARIFIMLADSSVISFTSNPSTGNLNWTSVLAPALSTLQEALKRPYMHGNKFLSALKLITVLVKESDECDKSKQDLHSVSIIRCLRDHPDMVHCMFKKFLDSMDNCNYISINSVLFEAFQVLTTKIELKGLFVEAALALTSFISNCMDDPLCGRTLFFPMWRILNTIIINLYHSENKWSGSSANLNSFDSLNRRVVSKVIRENVLAEFLPRPLFVEESEKAQWLQFSHKMVCDVWDITSFVIERLKTSELEDLALPLVEEAQRTFSSGPKMVVPYVITCLKSVIPTLSLTNLSKVLDCSWNACLEIRGNEAFRPALNSLIETIFQESMLKKNFCILLKYIEKFEELSKSTSGIFCTVIKQFCKVYSINSLLESDFCCVPVFVSALTYGPIHLKAHKIMEETLVYLIERNSSLADSLTIFDSNKPSFFVRIETINYLMKSFCTNFKCKEKFAFDLVESLLAVDGNSDGLRSSQFANSFSHRLKNRAWQAILLLLPTIQSDDLKEEIFLATLNNLGSENQQPSIRYLQEWVIFHFCSSNKLLDLFVSLFEQSLEKRPGYLISIISILNLLVLHQILKEESQLIRSFKLITVLCMAQNFTVRLYAQLTLITLCSLCKKLNVGSTILQYEFVLQITEMQSSLSEQGNFFKNVQKLSNDFYFSTFNPIHHFTLETIFFELPRLANLSPDEWIKPSLFGKCNCLAIYNSEDNLKASIPTSWSNKSNGNAFVSDNSSLDYNFQKKIIPAKDMIGDGNSSSLIDLNERKSTRHGLVVVASLINRIPNLGGLCRTCEIFGVSELVIGSLRYTDDKTFQNLAVSADKWVRIKEVKPVHLKEYLMAMKEQGYTLVGAEQTEDSHNLTEYQFTKKSVLLLGHEKEGLPVDLIQLLDACVEIPQQGVIRSLNVHVSGAILIWEYARQHNKSSNKGKIM